MHQRRQQQQSKSQVELLSSQALALDRARRIDYQDEQASGAGFRVAALLHHWMDTPSSNHDSDTADQQQEEEESVSQDAPGNSQRARFVTHFDLQRLQQWQRQKLQQQQQQQQEDQLPQPAEPDEDPQEILRQQLLDANHQTKKKMDQTEQGLGPAENESSQDDKTLDEEAEHEQRRQEELRQQLLQAATGQHDNSQQQPQQQPQHPLEDGTTSNHHESQEHSPRADFQAADSGVQDQPQPQDDQDQERQDALRQELVHQMQQHQDTIQQPKPLHMREEEGSKTQDTEEEEAERQERLRDQLIHQQQINHNNLQETVKQPAQDPHPDEQDERERQNALRDKLVKHMQNQDTHNIQHRNGDELERKDVTEEQQQEENEDKRQDVLREKLLDQMNHEAKQQDIQDDTDHVDSSQTRQLQDSKTDGNHASKTGETVFRIRPMTELVPHHDKHETSVQQEEDMVPSPSDEASWQQPNRRLRTLADYSKPDKNQETTSGAWSYPSQCGSNTTRVEITLVLQSTLDRAWILEETCRRWSDPIVAALVLTHTQAQQEEVQHLQDWRLTCPQIHIVTHVLPPPPRNVSSNENHYAENDAEYYPVNHLRNLGLDAVQTSHVLLVDVDFVPSHNLPDQIRHTLELRRLVRGQQFKEQQQAPQQHQEALIVPAFEKICHGSFSKEEQLQQEEACYHRLRHDSSFLPRSFEELRDCVMNKKNKNKGKNEPDGTCGVFQGRDNWEGHSSTHSSQWLSKAWYNKKQPISLSNGTTVHDIMPLECLDSLRYEPYVVVPWCPTRHPDEAATNPRDDTSHPLSPYYDERFHGYGKNKIEYIQHLRFLRYKFWIVPQGFVIHNPHAESKAKHEWKDDIDTHKKHVGGGGHSLHQDMDQLYPQFLTELVHLYVQPNESFSWLQDYPGVVGLCPQTKAYLKKALAARAGDR